MIGLFRTLVIFAIVYMVIRFFVRYVFPLLLGTYVTKKMSEMQQNQETYQHHQQKREGDVTIDVKPGKNKKHLDNTGEYVDFEEIK